MNLSLVKRTILKILTTGIHFAHSAFKISINVLSMKTHEFLTECWPYVGLTTELPSHFLSGLPQNQRDVLRRSWATSQHLPCRVTLSQGPVKTEETHPSDPRFHQRYMCEPRLRAHRPESECYFWSWLGIQVACFLDKLLWPCYVRTWCRQYQDIQTSQVYEFFPIWSCQERTTNSNFFLIAIETKPLFWMLKILSMYQIFFFLYCHLFIRETSRFLATSYLWNLILHILWKPTSEAYICTHTQTHTHTCKSFKSLESYWGSEMLKVKIHGLLPGLT